MQITFLAGFGGSLVTSILIMVRMTTCPLEVITVLLGLHRCRIPSRLLSTSLLTIQSESHCLYAGRFDQWVRCILYFINYFKVWAHCNCNNDNNNHFVCAWQVAHVTLSIQYCRPTPLLSTCQGDVRLSLGAVFNATHDNFMCLVVFVRSHPKLRCTKW